MEAWMSLIVGALFAVAIYLMLSKHIIRILIGVGILSNAVNLLIFTNGRLTRETPPIIEGVGDILSASSANPLPQALVLTAIVISFSFFAFLLVLGYRTYQELGSDNTEEMRVAEPEDEPLPPLGY